MEIVNCDTIVIKSIELAASFFSLGLGIHLNGAVSSRPLATS